MHGKSAIGGFGIGFIMWILEMAEVKLPILLLIGFAIIAIGMVVYGMIPVVSSSFRYVSKVRFRNPITKGINHPDIARRVERRTPPRQEYDGVLWEDGGRDIWGGVDVIGPLCPKDYTPLSMKHNDRIEAGVRYDTTISISGYHSQLVCLKCHTEYILSNEPKRLQESHDEVAILIIGIRNRAQQSQED